MVVVLLLLLLLLLLVVVVVVVVVAVVVVVVVVVVVLVIINVLVWKSRLIIGSKSLYYNFFGGRLRMGFSELYNSPNLNRSGQNSENRWKAMVRTHTINWRKSPEGFCLRVPKRVLFFSPMQNSLSHSYAAPILTIIEIKTLISVLMHILVKNFQISAHGVFQAPKTAKMGNFKEVTAMRLQHKWQNFG